MTLPRHPDDEPRLTALDGRPIDVSVSPRDESVSVVVLGTDTIPLSGGGARMLARLLVSGADLVEGVG